MTYFFAVLTAAFFTASASGQGAVEIYTDKGEKFTMVCNDKQINTTPAAEVRATGLSGETAELKLVFEDSPTDTLITGVKVTAGHYRRYALKQYKHMTYFEKLSADMKESVNTLVGEPTSSKKEYDATDYVVLFKRELELDN